MVMGGGESVEVGAVSFRIGVDLTQFMRDLGQAEELARQRASQIQQHFSSLAMGTQGVAQAQMGHGPIARRAVEQAAAGQLGLPGFERVEQVFKQRMRDVQALRKTQIQPEIEQLPTPEPPAPPEPPPIERVRKVKTRDYHTTETGAPEAVSPPTPVAQKREVATTDVRSSTAPQELPPPLPPGKVQVAVPPQIVAIPGPPPPPTFPLTQVNTASGQPMFVPSRVSGPTATQRQVPPTISGIPAAQRPIVHIPPSGLPPSPVDVAPRHGVELSGREVGPPAHPPAVDTGAVAAAAQREVAEVQQGVAGAIDQATQSLKGQFVRWTGPAGARMEGKVTSEKPGGRLRVNVGGAWHTVQREKVETPWLQQPAAEEAAPAAEVAPAPVTKPKRAPRAPRTAAPAATTPAATTEPAATTGGGAPAPRGEPLIQPRPPDLPRSGQPPRVYLEPPPKGALRQQGYVLAPTGIYHADIPWTKGMRSAERQQLALGQYFSGAAQKIPPSQFPPYARHLAMEKMAADIEAREKAERAAAAPPRPAGPTVRPGEIQQVPELTPALGPEETQPPVAPLEIRPMEEEPSVIQREAPQPAIEPTRRYEYQRSRSIAEALVTGPAPYLESFREGERPITTPLSRKEAAARLRQQRQRAREGGIATPPERIPMLARGGETTPGKPHLVGEEGPEIFVPKQAGYILPTQDVKRYAAGGPVTPEESTEFKVADFIRKRGKKGFTGEELSGLFQSLGLPVPGGKFGGKGMPGSEDLKAMLTAIPAAKEWYGEIGGGLATMLGPHVFNEARLLTAITSPRTAVVENIAQAVTAMSWLRELEVNKLPIASIVSTADVEQARAVGIQKQAGFAELQQRREAAVDEFHSAMLAGDAAEGRRVLMGGGQGSLLGIKLPGAQQGWSPEVWEDLHGKLAKALAQKPPPIVLPKVGEIQPSQELYNLWKATPGTLRTTLTGTGLAKIAAAYTTGIAEASGSKTPSYASNIGSGHLRVADPFTTIDTWMAGVFGYGTGKGQAEVAASDPRISRAIHGAVMALAEQHGMQGFEAQAALWLPFKTIVEAGRAAGTGPGKEVARKMLAGEISPAKAIEEAHRLGMFANVTGNWAEVEHAELVKEALKRLEPFGGAGPGLAASPGKLGAADLIFRGLATKGEPLRGVSRAQREAFTATPGADPIRFAIASTPRRAAGGPVDVKTITAAVAGQMTMATLQRPGLKPAAEIAARMGPPGTPAFVPAAHAYMSGQAARLAAGAVTQTQVATAYLTTLSSMRGAEWPRATAEEAAGGRLPESAVHMIRGHEAVRPEDAFANWLMSLTGRQTMDMIHAGQIGEARTAILAARKRALGFGYPAFFGKKDQPAGAFLPPKAGAYSLHNIPAATEAINVAGRSGVPGAVEQITGSFAGVGVGKQGFLASWVGSGRLPTLDNNALEMWLGPTGGKLAQKAMGSPTGQNVVGPALQQAVIQRHKEIQQLGYLSGIEEEHLPALMHWAIFDAAKGASTRHEVIIDALIRAGAGRARGGAAITNPWLLHTEAGPGLEALSATDVVTHRELMAERQAQLAQEIETAQRRIEWLGTIERPPWAAGITNERLHDIATEFGMSGGRPHWWEVVGLVGGSGELRELLSRTGIRGGGIAGGGRARLAQLRREHRQIDEALRQIKRAASQTFYRIAPGELPFDTGAAPAPSAVDDTPAWLKRAREAHAPATTRLRRAETTETPTGRPHPSAPRQAPAPAESYFRQITALTPEEITRLTAGTVLEGKLESGIPTAPATRASEVSGATEEYGWGRGLAGEMPFWMRRHQAARAGQPIPAATESELEREPARPMLQIYSLPEMQAPPPRPAPAAAPAPAAPEPAPIVTPPPPAPVVTPPAPATVPPEVTESPADIDRRELERRKAIAAKYAAATPAETPAATAGLPPSDRPGIRAAREREAAAKPPSDPGVKAAIDYLNDQIKSLGPNPQGPQQKQSGYFSLSRSLLAAGTSIEDLEGALVRAFGMSKQTARDIGMGVRVAVLDAVGGGVAERPGRGGTTIPSEAGLVINPGGGVGFLPYGPPVPYSMRGPAPGVRPTRPAATPQVTAVTAAESQRVLEHLTARQSELSVDERILHAVLSGGTSIDKAATFLGGAGVRNAQEFVATVRHAAEPQMAKPRGPGFFGRLAQGVGGALVELSSMLSRPPAFTDKEAAIVRRRLGIENEQERIRRRLGLAREPVPPPAPAPVQAQAETDFEKLKRIVQYEPVIRRRQPVAEAAPRAAGPQVSARFREQQAARDVLYEELLAQQEELSKLIPRAAGGPADETSGVYVVGERGPELFVPHAPGYVLAHDQAKRAVAEGRVGRIGHRQGGGGVTPQRATEFLQGGGQAGRYGDVMREIFERIPDTDLENLAERLRARGVPRREAGQAVQQLRIEAAPGRQEQLNLEPALARASEMLAAPPPERATQAEQAAHRRNVDLQIEAVRRLTVAYQVQTGARRSDAEAMSLDTARTAVFERRQQELTRTMMQGGVARATATERARELATVEARAAGILPPAPEQAAVERQRGRGPFHWLGQTGTQFVREIGAIAGVNLGLNVVTGIARELHNVIAATVDETVRLSTSATQLGVAFGAASGQFQAGGFREFQAAPLTTQTQAQYQQTALALAPVAEQFQLSDQQVRELTRDSGQLAEIWGVDSKQAAGVLQQMLRGNVEAGEQFNLNLVDQYGRIRDLGVSYQELASVIGPQAATQRVLADVQMRVNQQVSEFNALAGPQTQQLVNLHRAWAEFQTNLANVAATPVTNALRGVNALLADTARLLGLMPQVGAGQQQPQGGAAAAPAALAGTPSAPGAAVIGGAIGSVAGALLLSPFGPIGVVGGAIGGGIVGATIGEAVATAGQPQPARRAFGGSTSLRGSYMVGERGPELFVPRQAGYVLSNSQTQQALAAGATPRQEGGDVEPPIRGGTIEADRRSGLEKLWANLTTPGGPAQATMAPPTLQEAQRNEARETVRRESFNANVERFFSGILDPFRDQAKASTPVISALSQALVEAVDPSRTLAENLQKQAAASDKAAAAAQAVAEPPSAAPSEAPTAPATTPISIRESMTRIGAWAEEAYDRTEAINRAQTRYNQAQRVAQQARARLTQDEAQSALRALDIERVSVTVDGQRLSAQQAINSYAGDRLQLENQVVPIQLRQQQLQNRVAIATQEDLDIRRQVLQAQRATVLTGAAVTTENLQYRQAQQQAKVSILGLAGQVPGGVPPMQDLFRRMWDIQTKQLPLAELADTTAQLAAVGPTTAQSVDQITKQLSVIDIDKQIQANDIAIRAYEEQINAAQASSDAVTRVLQMADLIASPERMQAQKDLNEATLAAARADEEIARRILASAGIILPEAQHVGEEPPIAGPEVGQAPPPPLPGPGTPSARASVIQRPLPPPAAPTTASAAQLAATVEATPAPAAAAAETTAQTPSIAEVAGGVAAAITPEQQQQILDQRIAEREALMQGGWSTTQTKATQQQLLQISTGVGPRQAGGPVAQASSYLVGEAGPELFVPHGNGWGMSEDTVAISNMLRSAGGGPTGGDTHVHLNMGDVTVRSHDDILAMQQAVIDAATRGTLQALRRGNSYMPRRVSPSVAGGRGF